MQRLITALLLIAVAVYLIWWSPSVVFLGAAIVMGSICYLEYSQLAAAHGVPKPDVFGILLGFVAILRPGNFVLGAALILIVATAWAIRVEALERVLPRLAYTFFGVIYAFIPWRFAIDLRARSIHLLFFALALNWVGDTAAYYVGKAFGKHRLAPAISPKKTWEGAIASAVGSIAFGLVYLGIVANDIPAWMVAGMALAGNIAGQFGDLAESAIKRAAGVKDSGHLLPGHGGMLDRVDSSLFSLPVVYALLLVRFGLR